MGEGLRRRPAHGRAGFFASLSMEKLEALKSVYAARSDRGLKSPAEDAMVEAYRHCVWNLNPARELDRHAAARLRAASARRPHPPGLGDRARRVRERRGGRPREIYGDEVFWLPWMRPGFELGLALEAGCKAHPEAAGVDPRPARPHQLARRRSGLLRPKPRPDRAGRGVHRRARSRGGRPSAARRSPWPTKTRDGACSSRRCRGFAARCRAAAA